MEIKIYKKSPKMIRLLRKVKQTSQYSCSEV